MSPLSSTYSSSSSSSKILLGLGCGLRKESFETTHPGHRTLVRQKRVLEDEDSLPDEASGLGFQTRAASEVGTTKDEDDYAGAFFLLSSCTSKAHEP